MRLLKIGTLNAPRDRWEDALDVFEEVDVFCFDHEVPIDNERIHYIKFNAANRLNMLFFKAASHFSTRKNNVVLCNICMFVLKIINFPLLHKIKKTKYDFIHSSYNDFDESAFLTLLLRPKKYLRAQKETRLYYTYFEKKAFENASVVVLNDPLNKILFEKKYGKEIFFQKEILFDLDEDVRSKKIKDIIQYLPKLSEKDGRIHAVILAGRVLSDPNDSRSGGRLYYMTLINELLKAGMVIHLHTANIVEFDGKNPYMELSKLNENFVIEDKLDFSNDTINAYAMLSRYDVGICHAHIPNAEVTEFDKINIPHRYYEYQLAHVVPVDIKGKNLLLDKKAIQGHAVTYDSYDEMKLEDFRNIEWDIPTFSEYIRKIYY